MRSSSSSPSLLTAVAFALLGLALAGLAVRPSVAQQGGAPAAAGAGGPKLGDKCLVYLRGDAAGASFNDRVPSLGNLVTVEGELTDIDGAWLVLRGEKGKRLWVPRSSVMVVEVAG